MSLRSPRGPVPLWIRLGILVFVVLFVMVWEHVQAVRLERQVKKLRREADRLRYENGRMQARVNQREAPSYLDAIARSQLGMVPLDAKNAVEMDKP